MLEQRDYSGPTDEMIERMLFQVPEEQRVHVRAARRQIFEEIQKRWPDHFPGLGKGEHHVTQFVDTKLDLIGRAALRWILSEEFESVHIEIEHVEGKRPLGEAFELTRATNMSVVLSW